MNIILNPKNINEFLCPSNIEDLYTFLYNNGYSINYEFTKLMQNKNLSPDSKLLFYINKN